MVFMLLVFVGCSKIPTDSTINKNNTNTAEKNDKQNYDKYQPYEVYYFSKNVYEAELVDIDVEEYKNCVYGYMKITVKIISVYKGDFKVGETVEDVVWQSGLSPALKRHTKYLFMTGFANEFADKEFDKDDNEQNPYRYQTFNIVPIEKCSEYLKSKEREYSYSSLLKEMLFVERAEALYAVNLKGEEYLYEQEIDIGEFYALADNVYLGEILEVYTDTKQSAEIIPKNYNTVEKCDITKVKIKVLSVKKGEYETGDIIIDVLPISYMGVEFYIDNKSPLVCISGDDFFKEYDDLIKE